ncbi:MAG: hypothetical protein H0W66_01145 [Chthoniobacterales bacterium]|nr:hypothetical protein [Chthoniobacterales bacterium]
MKLPITIALCLAAFVLVTPSTAPAKEKKTSTETATASASPEATAKPPRPTAYRGKIASVDASAKTFTVGKHTIKVTDETKITKNDAATTMADIVADEQVRGSYWKKEDGSLEAKSVKLGAKPAGKTKSAAKTEAPEASPSAEPKK